MTDTDQPPLIARPAPGDDARAANVPEFTVGEISAAVKSAIERGFAFVRRAAHVIWSGAIDDWHEGDHLTRALAEAGLDAREIEREAADEAAAFDAEIARNETDQRAAGHWGVPLFVFGGEPFFGQDRLDHLIWRMRQAGLAERSEMSGAG